MADSLLLSAAFVFAQCGMACFALAMQVHWAQVHGSAAPTAGEARTLRAFGSVGVAASLALCLAADHVSMASLVWVMMLSVSAVVLACVLAYRPRLLRVLLAWVR